MNAPTPFAHTAPPPSWVTPVWRVDWSKYRALPFDWSGDWSRYPGQPFEIWWQLELIAIRYAAANKKEIRRQRNIAKYGPQIAA